MRLFRHLHPILFFSRAEKRKIVSAIQAAERQTNGEIRVYLDRKEKGHILEHARHVFERLGMTRTEHRNGVLIYIALYTKRFAILGDIGIHGKVASGFWKTLAESLEAEFKKGNFEPALVKVIQEIGQELARHFPHSRQDRNELPDRISCSI